MSTEVLVTTARRSWPTELKHQILPVAEQPGSSVCSVANAHNTDPAQLYQWRKKYRTDHAADDPSFIPVDIGGDLQIPEGTILWKRRGATERNWPFPMAFICFFG